MAVDVDTRARWEREDACARWERETDRDRELVSALWEIATAVLHKRLQAEDPEDALAQATVVLDAYREARG
ncbi:MAG: hypothetical protein ACRD2Z_09670 [Thermoanaerobaculia bacterium]